MRYVGLEHIEADSMRLLGHGHAREARSSSVRFSKGDILYGKMRPYLNKVWVAEFDGLCSAEFLVFKKHDGLNNQFLATRLNAEDFVSFANGQVSGERLMVSNAHISVVAQTTEHDLNRYLSQTDIFNGFGNRFLWFSVERSKLLPEGGGIREKDLSVLEKQLKKSVEFARSQKLIPFSHNAAVLWRERYPQLTADVPGLVGAVTSRAESQVRRVALIFALMYSANTWIAVFPGQRNRDQP